MSGLEAMIAQAEKSLGLGEYPDNTNYITNWYGLNGEPWCDQAISYWAWHSGNAASVVFGGKYAYTVSHAQAFRDHGQWHTDVAGIRRGDIVFFDWDDSNSIGAIDHVGIVTGTQGSAVLTVEGNIGNVCARKVRYADTIAGYGRPAYTGASNNAPAPSSGPVVTPTGTYQAFPGTAYFKREPRSPLIEKMGQRLVAEGCGRYSQGPGPQWTESDRASYAAWQRKCGFSGSDADGYPGASTWNRLRVPK